MFKLLALVVFNTATWVSNSVFFWQITLAGEKFSALFLLWFTDIPYFFLLPLFYKYRGPPTLKAHLIYIAYSIFAMADSLLETISAPRISGMIQAILSAAIPLPTVGLLAWFVLKQHFGRWQIFGALLVLAASGIQISASVGGSDVVVDGAPLWAFVFAAGLAMGSVVTIIWEMGLSWYGVDPMSLVLWSTVYSAPLYVIAVVFSGLLWGWEDEKIGLDCFFAINGTCSQTAWISVTGYGLTSVLSDYVQMYLVAMDSAFFLLIADAVSTPLLAIIFALPVFGAYTEPFTWQSIVSTVLVVVGMLVYKKPEIEEWWIQRRAQRAALVTTGEEEVTNMAQALADESTKDDEISVNAEEAVLIKEKTS